MYDKKHTDRGVIEVLYINAAFNIDKYNVMYLQQLLCCKAIYIQTANGFLSVFSFYRSSVLMCK